MSKALAALLPEGEAEGPWITLDALRRQAPTVQTITDFAAIDLAAGLLLAAGAAPVTLRAPEEVEDFVGFADALTVSIGTLSAAMIEPMAAAAREAVAQGKPWVLDPVGAGTTVFRAEAAKRLSGLQPSVIRGNGAEILALGGGQTELGLDPDVDSVEALDAAHDLARATGAVVAVTGPVDYITDGRNILAVANGDRLMTRVSALGCALNCVIGACCAVEENAVAATANALAIVGVAGEIAAAEAAGPGSFRTYLIDALYNLDEATLNGAARIQ